MIDFWLAVILTVVVSLLTVLADWVASRLIAGVRTIRALQRILRAGLSVKDTHDKIKQELERYSLSQLGSLAWGVNLAVVTID